MNGCVECSLHACNTADLTVHVGSVCGRHLCRGDDAVDVVGVEDDEAELEEEEVVGSTRKAFMLQYISQ